MPPVDLSAPAGLSWAFTIVCLTFLLAALVYVGWLARRGESMGIVMLVGGLLASSFEVFADYVGLLWFADDNVAITINLMGRHVPLYVVVGYVFFFGLQAYIDFRAISLGLSAKYFVYSFGFAWLFDFGLQATGATFDLYHYYGNNPFRVFGAPVWWFTIDGIAPMLIALLLFVLRYRLTGWGRLLPIFVVPATYAGWNGATGLPIFVALNSNYDTAVNGNGSTSLVWLGGCLTIGVCLLFGWIALDEIRRAQVSAGIPIRREFSLRDLLFAPLPGGVGAPRASGEANVNPVVKEAVDQH
ncbi:hypothetical protein [Frankia sp. EAN1pec]|uniref:hypothetical protein n=1 Tax=Parafrankia sp. (strain EAN1pec) TaxID=298653 RepID=UPI00059ED3D0